MLAHAQVTGSHPTPRRSPRNIFLSFILSILHNLRLVCSRRAMTVCCVKNTLELSYEFSLLYECRPPRPPLAPLPDSSIILTSASMLGVSIPPSSVFVLFPLFYLERRRRNRGSGNQRRQVCGQHCTRPDVGLNLCMRTAVQRRMRSGGTGAQVVKSLLARLQSATHAFTAFDCRVSVCILTEVLYNIIVMLE